MDDCKQEVSPNKAILVLVGLPATGKTWLARSLTASLAFKDHSTHIEFDEQYMNISKGVSFSPLLWHESRELSYQLIQRAALSPPSPSRHLIIVDDNTHLRSMRRRCFRMARDTGCCYLLVHLSACSKLSIERNRARKEEARVMKESILSMAASFEEPDAALNKWEGPILTIDAEDAVDVDQVIAWINSHWGPPPQPLPEESKLADTNHDSLIHQLDLKTRRIVSRRIVSMAADKAGLDDKRAVAAHLNAERRKMISLARIQLKLLDLAEDEAVSYIDELDILFQVRINPFVKYCF